MKKVKSKKKTVKKNIVAEAIKLFKVEYPDYKTMDQSDLYGIESHIDGLLYEKQYAHYGYIGEDGRPVEDCELILERLTFSAIKILQKGKRHTCDPHYDDAFKGYDGY